MFNGNHHSGSKPCPHMRMLVSAWVDGRLAGLARWYTEWHIAHCRQCTSAVPFLQTLHARLHAISGDCGEAHLTDERWAAIEAALETMEREKAGAS